MLRCGCLKLRWPSVAECKWIFHFDLNLISPQTQSGSREKPAGGGLVPGSCCGEYEQRLVEVTEELETGMRRGGRSLMCNSIICLQKQRSKEKRTRPLFYLRCSSSICTKHVWDKRNGKRNYTGLCFGSSLLICVPASAGRHTRRTHKGTHTHTHTLYKVIPHPKHFRKHMSGLTGPLVRNPIPFSLSAHSRLVISFNLADEKRQMFVLSSTGARLWTRPSSLVACDPA